jgi:hypothetical protein
MPLNNITSGFLQFSTGLAKLFGYTVAFLWTLDFIVPGNSRIKSKSLLPLQIVVIQSMAKFNLPGNVLVFFREMKSVSFFDLIP